MQSQAQRFITSACLTGFDAATKRNVVRVYYVKPWEQGKLYEKTDANAEKEWCMSDMFNLPPCDGSIGAIFYYSNTLYCVCSGKILELYQTNRGGNTGI